MEVKIKVKMGNSDTQIENCGGGLNEKGSCTNKIASNSNSIFARSAGV